MKRNKGLYPALIQRLGEMVKENVELEQRVHQLMDDYNHVARKLRAKDDADSKDGKGVIEQMRQMRDLCDRLEREKKAAEVNYNDLRSLTEKKNKQLERYEQADFVEIGTLCAPQIHGRGKECILAGSAVCMSCPHFVKYDVYERQSMLCASRYDCDQEEGEQPSKETTENAEEYGKD